MDSSDQLTTKLLIKLQNGALAEAVIMRYDTLIPPGRGFPGGDCGATGSCFSYFAYTQCCFHGNFLIFTCLLWCLSGSDSCHDWTTISFVAKENYCVHGLNLAVSLHAPVQEIRCQIMPASRAFPLVKLMDTLQEYQKNTQQKIFIEYIMLDGVNDEEQNAHQLGKLLETFQVVVNLIPFNPIGDLSKFSTSNEEKVSSFQKILRGTYGIRTTVRKEMGQDISGACGQLVVNKRSIENTVLLTDIEDLQAR